MKNVHYFFYILTLITTTHIHGMLELYEDTTTHLCSFLDSRTITTLKKTCKSLYKQLDWDKAEFVIPLSQNPEVLYFLISKLRNHVKKEEKLAVTHMLSWPITNLVNMYDKHDVTPLMQACSCSSDTMISVLLEHGACLQLPHIDSTIVHQLFIHGVSADTIEKKLQTLVASKDKVTMEQVINQPDHSNFTPLHYLLSRVHAKNYPLSVETTLQIITILRRFYLDLRINNFSHITPLDMLYEDFNSACGRRCTKKEYDAIWHALAK